MPESSLPSPNARLRTKTSHANQQELMNPLPKDEAQDRALRRRVRRRLAAHGRRARPRIDGPGMDVVVRRRVRRPRAPVRDLGRDVRARRRHRARVEVAVALALALDTLRERGVAQHVPLQRAQEVQARARVAVLRDEPLVVAVVRGRVAAEADRLRRLEAVRAVAPAREPAAAAAAAVGGSGAVERRRRVLDPSRDHHQVGRPGGRDPADAADVLPHAVDTVSHATGNVSHTAEARVMADDLPESAEPDEAYFFNVVIGEDGGWDIDGACVGHGWSYRFLFWFFSSGCRCHCRRLWWCGCR